MTLVAVEDLTLQSPAPMLAKSGRIVRDAYMTPEWQTDHLMRVLWPRLTEERLDPLIIEPCVGEGHIVRAANEWVNARWITNDVYDGYEFGADYYEDASKDAFWQKIAALDERPEWGITNVPFLYASQIIPRMWEVCTTGIAVLLRSTWKGVHKDRKDFLVAHPPTWELTMERCSYTRNGKVDFATAAWFVWFKDESEPQIIRILPGRGEQPELSAWEDGDA